MARAIVVLPAPDGPDTISASAVPSLHSLIRGNVPGAGTSRRRSPVRFPQAPPERGHPRIDAVLDLPPDGTPVRSHAARLLAVQQAVRGQEWLRRAFGAQNETAAWGLSQTLLAICDELNARWLEDAAIRDDDDIDGDDRAALLQGALERTYSHLSERFLGEEARIVLAFWQALSGPDYPLPARRRA